MKTLIEQGWYMYKACNCGGTRLEKYKHNDFSGLEIKVRPTRNRVQYVLFNRVVVNGTIQTIDNDIETAKKHLQI